MADITGVYDGARKQICDFARELDDEGLATKLPACPKWDVKDVIAHMAGVAGANATGGGVPFRFLDAWRDETAAAELNAWTAAQVETGQSKSLEDVIEEWEKAAADLTARMRGEMAWPENAPPFVDRIVTTDTAAHQQDIFGAFGIEEGREAPPVKIGLSTYIGGVELRMEGQGLPALRFDVGHRQWTVGGDEPAATVRASRFELFRALSGRRAPDQVKAFDWDGDPEPYMPFFYPYGVREDALVE